MLIIPRIIRNRYIDKIIIWGRLEDEQINEHEVNVHVVWMEREINAYKISAVKPEGNRAFGRSKYVWENDTLNVGYLKNICSEGVDGSSLVQNRYHTEKHFCLLQSVQAGSGTNTNFHRVGTACSILGKRLPWGIMMTTPIQYRV